MTKNANVETLTIGQIVYNPAFANYERRGEIIEKDGALAVSFVVNGKVTSSKKLELWQPLPQEILDNTQSKQADKSEKPEGEKSDKLQKREAITPEVIEPLSNDEKSLFKKHTDSFFKQEKNQENAEKQKAIDCFVISSNKLFRENYKTFKDFAVEVLKVHDKYAHQLVAIGEYYTNNAETLENEKLSVRSVIALIRAQNEIKGVLTDSETSNAEMVELNKNLIQSAKQASLDEKGKGQISTKAIEKVASESLQLLRNVQAQKGENLLEKAASILSVNSSEIVQKAKDALTSKKTAQNGSNGSKSVNPQPVYDGVLPVMTIICSLHAIENNKISFITGQTFGLKCGCRFKLEGFELKAIQVDGKRVKTENK